MAIPMDMWLKSIYYDYITRADFYGQLQAVKQTKAIRFKRTKAQSCAVYVPHLSIEIKENNHKRFLKKNGTFIICLV